MAESKFKQIKKYLKKNKHPSYRWDQITTAIFEQGIIDFKNMTTLPKDLRTELTNKFNNVLALKPLKKATSDQATKVLFELEDGERIETVKMKFHNEERDWDSLCISSQVGCNLGCSFCATGQIGLKRNLTADEIVSQPLFFIHQGDQLNSISFMGMGEPLVNPNIFGALELLTNKKLFNFSQRRLSISTVGIVPQLKKLIKEYEQINIAFSLHTPFQEQREEIMPISKKFPIDEVMSVLDQHIRQNNRKVFIPYLMLRGVNDSMEHAQALRELILKRKEIAYLYHINLIHYHSTQNSQIDYKSSDEERINQFKQVFENSRIGVSVRQSFGQNIEAACGQLYAEYSQN